MITAHQAEIVALYKDSEIIHRDHVNKDEVHDQFNQEREETYGLSDWRFWELVEEVTGYQPLSRFDLHEIESANFADLEHHLDATELGEQVLDLISAGDYVESAEDVLKIDLEVDVSVYTEVRCDQCGERIE